MSSAEGTPVAVGINLFGLMAQPLFYIYLLTLGFGGGESEEEHGVLGVDVEALHAHLKQPPVPLQVCEVAQFLRRHCKIGR